MKQQKKTNSRVQVDGNKKEISVAQIGLLSAIIVAIIGLIGTALNAYFSSQAVQAPILLSIHATQTAEAKAITQAAPANFPPISVTPTILSYQFPSPGSTLSGSTLPPTTTGCTPVPLTELPSQSIALIEPLEGTSSHVSLKTLRYEDGTGLHLASGIFIEFNKMMSFELLNPNFTQTFDADVIITFLDCRTHNDVIKSESGSFITGETELGQLKLHILEVRRVDFQW